MCSQESRRAEHTSNCQADSRRAHLDRVVGDDVDVHLHLRAAAVEARRRALHEAVDAKRQRHVLRVVPAPALCDQQILRRRVVELGDVVLHHRQHMLDLVTWVSMRGMTLGNVHCCRTQRC